MLSLFVFKRHVLGKERTQSIKSTNRKDEKYKMLLERPSMRLAETVVTKASYTHLGGNHRLRLVPTCIYVKKIHLSYQQVIPDKSKTVENLRLTSYEFYHAYG